ncbi:MAG TPA: DUF4412 domain-containing protein [Blastocatellia bacterium]|nr:DUF4412 domain-containing protein [Blastocatellia bacterium]HMY72509.1 DUF4412 domain-containing protein [Blastocatellia bacterium]HMZ19573.1 DUF4412 domain-containing protein [Blastocatellia bacterium]HNG32890.1 DUF4412 domain-containing protein [Blastocatellia bacterium]
MTRLAVSGSKPIPQSPRTIFLISLLSIASLVGACSSSPKNTASESSSPASSAPANSAGGQFEGTITAQLFNSAQPAEISYAVKGTRMRIETKLSQGGTQTGVVLMDSASGVQNMLMPQTKTYLNLNLNKSDQFRQMAEKAGEAAGDFSKVSSMGQTETIAGHTCRHWRFADKQQTDACLAQGLGFFGGGGQSGGVFEQLKNLALGDKVKAQLNANPEFAKFVEGGAFPLKISQVENGQSKTVLEVIRVERKSLDDALFSVPADYKKMEIPGMPGSGK